MRFSAGLLAPRYWGRAPCVVVGLLPEDDSAGGYLAFAEGLSSLLARRAGTPSVYAPLAEAPRWWRRLLPQPRNVLNPEGHSPAAALARAARPGSTVRGSLDFRAAPGLPFGAHVLVEAGDPVAWLAVLKVDPQAVEALVAELGERVPASIDWEARAGTLFRTDFDRAWIGPHDTAGWTDGDGSVALSVGTGIVPAEVYLPALGEVTDPWLRRSYPQIVADFEAMGVKVVITPKAGFYPSVE